MKLNLTTALAFPPQSPPARLLAKLFAYPRRSYLLLILGFALAIRIYGITRNIPFIFVPDSVEVFVSPQNLLSQIFWEKKATVGDYIFPAAKYLPSFKYFLFYGFLIVTFLVTLYVQAVYNLPFSAASSKAVGWLVREGGLLVTGRLIVAIFGLLTIYFLYRLGKEIFSGEVGLIAALFMAIMPQHVMLSQHVWVDNSLFFWTVLLAMYSYKMASTGELKYYLLAGLSFGILFSTKYSGPFFALFLLHAHYLRIRREKPGWRKILRDRRVLYSIIMILVGIAITFPSFFLDIKTYIYYFIRTKDRSAVTTGVNLIRDFRVYWGYIPGLYEKMGVLFTLAIFVGGVMILFHENKPARVLAVTPFLFFIFMSRYPSKYYRWLGPAYPFFILWAAYCISWIMKKMTQKQASEQIRQAIVAITLTILIIKPLYISIKSTLELSRPDTRSVTREWIHRNVPSGSVFASYIAHFWALPPLDFGKYRYGLVDIPYKYYDLQGAMTNDRARPLDYYRKKGVKYFMLDSWHKSFHFETSTMKTYPKAAKSFQDFYNEMAVNSDLVFMLDPETGNYNGPGIELYRLKD